MVAAQGGGGETAQFEFVDELWSLGCRGDTTVGLERPGGESAYRVGGTAKRFGSMSDRRTVPVAGGLGGMGVAGAGLVCGEGRRSDEGSGVDHDGCSWMDDQGSEGGLG